MTLIQRVLALGAIGLLAACGAGTGERPPPADQGADQGVDGGGNPLDDVLRINHLQVKGTHNSYHVFGPDALDGLRYAFDPLDVQLGEQGVRAFELDTYFDENRGSVDVFHIPMVDTMTNCGGTWRDCLTVLKTWSDANPGHHVLFVQVEPKDGSFRPVSDWDAYITAIEAELLSVWPRERLVTPDDVQGDAPTLREAVVTRGWPTLGQTRQKALFFLNERGPFHQAYTRQGTDVSGRLMFPESKPEEPIAAVLVINDPANPDLDGLAAQNFLIRTRADEFPPMGDPSMRRAAALAGGAHVISTDWPTAKDGIAAFELPDNRPSRCNPVTAPPECTPDALDP